MAEAEELEAVERERARRRMLSGKSVEPSGNISVGSKGETRDKVAAAVERERARRRQAHGRTAPGKNASGNISPSDKGRARDKVAAACVLLPGINYKARREPIPASAEEKIKTLE